MSKQSIRKPLSMALGTALISTLGAAGVANADEGAANLFSMEELTHGYLTAGGHAADGSCGGDGDKDGSCGGDGDKDGSCGGDGDKDGSCGGDDEGEGDGEGGCGEGKCGSA